MSLGVPRLESRLLAAVVALLLGCAITALPFAVSRLNYEGLWLINFVEMPGGIAAVLLSGGNIHTYSFTVMVVANASFYWLVLYLLLRAKKASSQGA